MLAVECEVAIFVVMQWASPGTCLRPSALRVCVGVEGQLISLQV